MTSTFSIQAADHPIKSVTVFKSSKAEVVRTFKLDLQKGQNKIEVKGLSSAIDPHSVRVSGLGDARLFDVVCVVQGDNSENPDPDSSSEVIRKLRVERLAHENQKRIIEQESSLLLQYGETLNGEFVDPTQMGQFLQNYVERERKNLELKREILEKMLQLDRKIIAETEKAASKRGTAHGQVDIVIVADDANAVELKLTYIVGNTQWTPTYELHATTENGKPSSSVSLHYRARVTQRTGEDWNNTSLTLSTVTSDTVVRRIPQLRTIKLRQAPAPGSLFNNNGQGFKKFSDNANAFKANAVQTNNTLFGPNRNNVNPFEATPAAQGQGLFGSAAPSSLFGGTTSAFGQPQQQQQQSTGFGAFGGGAFGSAPQPQPQQPSLFGTSAPPPPPEVTVDPTLMARYEAELLNAESAPLPDDDDFESVEGPGPITQPSTFVSETPMALSFSVHGESTIPSDGIDHQVSVAILPFTAKISYIAIPRIDPRVFLQCEVENSSEYRLLPGPVTVILDDSYVSKTSINDINTGDNFECTLGDDASTKVTYERNHKTIKSTGGAFSEVTNTTTYTTKISIHNKHQFAITDLIVRDVIPTCDDKRAKIVLRKPEGLADAKDGQLVDVKETDGLRVGWEKLVDGKGGEKEGKFEWQWKVGNGAKVKLEAEWEVKAPGEVAWVETF